MKKTSAASHSMNKTVWIVDRTGRLIVGIGAVMLALNLAAVVLFPKQGGRVISGDATGHFVQLRSLVYDRDLDFSNEYTRLYLTEHPNEPAPNWHELLPTPTGRIRNYMPIGPALLWLPLYLIVSGVLAAAAAVGLTTAPDGFERALQLVPNVTGVVAATAGAWLAWRLAARLVDRASASIGVLAVWLGSNALYYSLVAPSYSHSASMFASALLLTHWLARRERWSWRQAAISGMLAGLASLMRWQDVLWLAVPIIESMVGGSAPAHPPTRSLAPFDSCSGRPEPCRGAGSPESPLGSRGLARVRSLAPRVGRLVAVGVGWLIVFSPQMAVWNVLYGSPLTVPQGGGFMEWTAPDLLAVLTAAKHGLFTWSPILLPAAFGLATLAWRDRRLALPVGVVVLCSWYVNAAAADWWAGEAFGARRFLSLFPLFVLGLSAWLQPDLKAGRIGRLILVAFLVIANGLFLFQYQVFMKGWRSIAPYPDESWVDLWLMRFVVPFRVLARWIS